MNREDVDKEKGITLQVVGGGKERRRPEPDRGEKRELSKTEVSGENMKETYHLKTEEDATLEEETRGGGIGKERRREAEMETGVKRRIKTQREIEEDTERGKWMVEETETVKGMMKKTEIGTYIETETGVKMEKEIENEISQLLQGHHHPSVLHLLGH